MGVRKGREEMGGGGEVVWLAILHLVHCVWSFGGSSSISKVL